MNKSLRVVISDGWFDAPYIRALLDAESPERIKDIEGPDSDALIDYAGWSFIEEPLHAALLDGESHTLALAWIAATTRGLNLTYIVAESAAGKGLAAMAVAQAVMAYGERRVDRLSKPRLSVHAQYERANQASARVAARLGLLPTPQLAFEVSKNGVIRYFEGSEAAWSTVFNQAITIATKKPDHR